MKSFGFVGDGQSVFAEVETGDLTAFSDRYFLVLVILQRDRDVESLSEIAISDNRAQFGEPFMITGKRIRTVVRVTDEFKFRLNNITGFRRVGFYLCLLPKATRDVKMSTLDDVNKHGGHIVGDRTITQNDEQPFQPLSN